MPRLEVICTVDYFGEILVLFSSLYAYGSWIVSEANEVSYSLLRSPLPSRFLILVFPCSVLVRAVIDRWSSISTTHLDLFFLFQLLALYLFFSFMLGCCFMSGHMFLSYGNYCI